MTRKLYDEDSYIKTFTATVISCEECDGQYRVVLDATAFFPEGGGQASDIGYLDNAKVFEVQIDGDIIYHFTDKPLIENNMVEGKIDWSRRFDYMQQHSGEHIVSGVAHKLYACENVGFHLSDDIVTLDFDKYLERDQILEIERVANEKVHKNVRFSTYYPDNTTLKKLNYRSKKDLEGKIRIVEIEDTDMCACCAPHVETAGEIGIIKLLDSERLRGGVRIELKCGMRALQDYNAKYNNTALIGAALSVKQNETANAVEKLSASLETEKQKNLLLKKRLVEQMISVFAQQNVIFTEQLDIKELQMLSDGLHKKTGDFYAVFSKNNENFSFAFCGDKAETERIFSDFKLQFEVRGGGRNGMVQGTVQSNEKDIKLFFHI